MGNMSKVTTALLFCLAAAVHVAQGSVVELTVDNYVQTEEGLWLIEFFAPWCGHCKHLKPIYEEASDAVASYGLRLGAVDVTQHKPLATQYEVKGYPTILWRRDGDEPEKYTGERNVAGFVAFAEKMVASAVRTLASADEIATFIETAGKGKVAFVLGEEAVESTDGDAAPPLSPLHLAFARVATQLQADFAFATSTAPSVVTRCCLCCGIVGDAPVIAKIQRGGEDAVRFPGSLDPLDEAALVEWIKAERFEIFPYLDQNNFFQWSRQVGKLSMIFVAKPTGPLDGLDAVTEEFLDLGRAVARPSSTTLATDVHKRFSYGWLNGSAWLKWIELYEIERTSLPAVFVLDAAGHQYWTGASLSDVAAFAKSVDAGLIETRREGWRGAPGRYHRKAAKIVPALEAVPLPALMAVAACLAAALVALVIYGLCLCADDGEEDVVVKKDV